MQEEWRPIKDYEGIYEVSNLGRIKSLDRYRKGKFKNSKSFLKGKLLKLSPNKSGYLQSVITLNCIPKHLYVHREVALSFIDNKYNNKVVNHIDCNKQNNNISNLEWCTHLENTRHYWNMLKK